MLKAPLGGEFVLSSMATTTGIIFTFIYGWFGFAGFKYSV